MALKEDLIPVDFKSRRGNALLKAPGEKIYWTPQMVQEFRHCEADPVYFIENYVKIVHLDKGLIPFKLYEYQKEIIRKAHDNRFLIVATSRQVGKSTVMTAFILWYILFFASKTVAMLANKGEIAREILGRVHLSYQNLPKWLQQGVVVWNKGSIELENGSKVLAAATSSDAIRGYAINMLFLDEMAFVEQWESFESSVMPTISSSKESRVIMVSTPNNLNHFYKYWAGAHKKGEEWNGYQYVEVHWNEVPGRDKKWKKIALESLGGNIDKFNQEFDVEFLGSSGTLISGQALKRLAANWKTPTIERNGLCKYSDPIKGEIIDKPGSMGRQMVKVIPHRYACCVDVSEGKGFDYSAFSVFDVTQMPYEQVCTYRSNTITPIELTEIIYNTCMTYNEALVLIEHASLGPQVAESLHMDFDYEGVLMTESAGALGKRISTGGGKMIDKGVKMTINVKAHGCSLLKLLIEEEQLIINDLTTVSELSTFIRDGKTFKADENKYDDTVMALVVFAWLSNQQYFKDWTDINTIALLRDISTAEVEENLIPFGFFSLPEDQQAEITMEDLERNPDALSQMFNKADAYNKPEDVGRHKWQGDDSWFPYLPPGHLPNF